VGAALTNPNGDGNSGAFADRYCHPNPYTNRNFDGYTHEHSHGYGDQHAYPHPNSHSDQYPNQHADAHPHAHAGTIPWCPDWQRAAA
jgi:hypothetical protein